MTWTSFGGKLCSDSCRSTWSRKSIAWQVTWQLAFQNVWKWFVWFFLQFGIATLHVTCCHKSLWDGTSTYKTHWSIVARSCTTSRRSFTWEWAHGPKHEGAGKTLKHHHMQTQELSICICQDFFKIAWTNSETWEIYGNSLNVGEMMSIESEPQKTLKKNQNHRLESLECWWILNLRKTLQS